MKKLLLSPFLILLMMAFISIPVFAHNVEFVVIGGSEVRFQYANGLPMSNAKVYVLDENMEHISVSSTDEYGVFDYGRYFGIAARLEVHHNNYKVRFVLPETLPRVVISDRGVLLEVVVPAGSGGRLSVTSRSIIYIGIAFVLGFVALLIITRVRGKQPIMTKIDIVHSRRMPRYSGGR